MIQGRGRAGFLLKTLQAVSVVSKKVGQDFDGDVALQARVARAIHLAHSTCAKGFDNFVLPEHRSGSQGHGMGEYTSENCGYVFQCDRFAAEMLI